MMKRFFGPILAAAVVLSFTLLTAPRSMAAPQACVETSIQTGDTIASTATLTAFATSCLFGQTGVTPTIPSNGDPLNGLTYKVDLYGIYSTIATPGTLTFQMESFNNATLYSLGSTGAITPPVSMTAQPWRYQGVCTYNKTGAAGVAVCSGNLDLWNSTTSAWVSFPVFYAGTTGTTGQTTGVVTNASALTGLEATITWQTSNAGNTITQQQASYNPIVF